MTLSDFAGWDGLFLLIPLLIALVDVVKRIFPGMRKRVKPALVIVFGLGLSLYLGLVLGLSPLEQIWWGLVAGLGATGTYALGRRVIVDTGAAPSVASVEVSPANERPPATDLPGPGTRHSRG